MGSANVTPHTAGRWALVTGASDGIGRAMALQLALTGYSLVLVARRADRLQSLARGIARRKGQDVRIVALDLATPDAASRLDRETAAIDFDVVVLAAGYGSSGPFLDIDRAAELDMVDVNCRAVVECSHRFGTRMRERGSGTLVLFSSIVAFQGVPLSATYAATKAFVQTFAEGLRGELAPRGVAVLSVAPGPVDTGFAARAGLSVGQADTPERIARDVLEKLGTSGTIRPGLVGKLLGGSLSLLPRRGRTAIMARVMAGMVKPA